MGERQRKGHIHVRGHAAAALAPKVEAVEDDPGTGAGVTKEAGGGFTYPLHPAERDAPWVRVDVRSSVSLTCGTSDEEIGKAQRRAAQLARAGWVRDIDEIHELVRLKLDEILEGLRGR